MSYLTIFNIRLIINNKYLMYIYLHMFMYIYTHIYVYLYTYLCIFIWKIINNEKLIIKKYSVQISCSGQKNFPAPLPDTKACNNDMEVTIYSCPPRPASQARCSSVTTDYSRRALVGAKVAALPCCWSSQRQVCAKRVSGGERVPSKIKGLTWHPVSVSAWSASETNPIYCAFPEPEIPAEHKCWRITSQKPRRK